MTTVTELPQPREMKLSDLDCMPNLHRNCFPPSLSMFSALSDDIIKRYYAQAIEKPECVATVLEEPCSGRLIGLAFGTTMPDFQRQFLRKHFIRLCWNISKGLFISASVRKLLWMRLRRKGGSSLGAYGSVLADAGVPSPKGTEALFTLVGVHKQCRGGGNAERLVKYFTVQVFEAGAARIRGAIRPDNLGSLILHKRLGWHLKKVSSNEISVWLDRPEATS